MGPCAKTQVKCTIVAPTGEIFVGKNLCMSPQKVCPRLEGEDYTKCKTICNTIGHAETVALKLAKQNAVGATAYLEGHIHYCSDCQHKLYDAGVKFLALGSICKMKNHTRGSL